jgi:hypothetical protein
MFEEKLVGTTTNGTKLFVTEFSGTLNTSAQTKLGKEYHVFLAQTPDGHKSYLLVDGQEPIYENQNFESMACHIDALKMARDMK